MPLKIDQTNRSAELFSLNGKDSPKGKKVEGQDKESTISSSSEAKAWVSPNWFSNAATTVVNAVKWVFTSIWKLVSNLLCCSNPLRSMESFVKADAQKSAEQLDKDVVGTLTMFLEAAHTNRDSATQILADNKENLGNIIAKAIPLRIETLTQQNYDKLVKKFKKDEANHKEGKAVEPDEKKAKEMKEEAEYQARQTVEKALAESKGDKAVTGLIELCTKTEGEALVLAMSKNFGENATMLMFGTKFTKAVGEMLKVAREQYAKDEVERAKEASKKNNNEKV